MQGSQGPAVDGLGSFCLSHNNIYCGLGRSYSLSGPPCLVYKIKITAFGKSNTVSGKAICPCIYPLTCSSCSFIHSFICRLHIEDAIMDKRDGCGVCILVRNPDDKTVYQWGSSLCVGGDTGSCCGETCVC